MAVVEAEQTNLLCHWAGVDVAKDTFDASLVRSGQRYPQTPLSQVPARRFARTAQGVAEFVAWLDELVGKKDAVRVCMEATGRYSTDLAVWLLKARLSLRPAIVNPAHSAAFIKSMGLRNKTDKMDARALAFYGLERRPVCYEPPTKAQRELRELSRQRTTLVNARNAERNRALEPAASKVVLKIQKRRLKELDRDIKALDTAINKLVNADEELKHDVRALMQIDGVGIVTAVVVLTEMGDLRRFERARQLTAFAGLSPRVFESGKSVKGRTHMCKQGNARVRAALYMAAMAVKRGNKSDLAVTYQRLVANGKEPLVALAVVMRKLLCVMRAVLISGKPYVSKRKTDSKPVLDGGVTA